MSNNEKMNRLREKLLDAALAGSAEEARLYAEALGMMPQEDPILKAGVAEPKAGDDEALAKCVKSAKETLAKQGWVVLGDIPSAGETLRRMKKEGLDLFMGQGFPSLTETLEVLVKRGRPLSKDEIVRAMGFPERLMGVSFPCAPMSESFRARIDAWGKHHSVDSAKDAPESGKVSREQDVFVDGYHGTALFRWTEPAGLTHTPPRLPSSITEESLRSFACSRDGLAYKTDTGRRPESALVAEIVGWINDKNYYLDFVEWERLSRSKASPPVRVPNAEPSHWFVPNAVTKEAALCPVATRVSLPDGTAFETLAHNPVHRRHPIPLRLVHGDENAPGIATLGEENGTPKPIAGFSVHGRVYRTWKMAEVACGVGFDHISWYVPDLVSSHADRVCVLGGSVIRVSDTSIGGGVIYRTVRNAFFTGRTPIALITGSPKPTCGAATMDDPPPCVSSKGHVYATLEEAMAALCVPTYWFVGRVFDCLVSAKAHIATTTPAHAPDPLMKVWHAEPVATHWFVPSVAVALAASEAGHRVSQEGSRTSFYSLASDRAVDRSPIPLRLDPSGATPNHLGGVWRIFKPGVTVTGCVFPSLEEAKFYLSFVTDAPAPKRVRYGLLDINVAGQSNLTIVESVDGAPTGTLACSFSPGPVLSTMLDIVHTCFRHGVTSLYAAKRAREDDIRLALALIATFMRGEALHDLAEADRASFLRMTTTFEWPRTYTIPTFKVLAPL